MSTDRNFQQAPQFILEALGAGEGAKVVVAQPRRIAAVGVATRVAAELGERTDGGRSGGRGVTLGEAGSRVGYAALARLVL